MDKKTQGSWLIHHTNKLQGVSNQSGYEKTYLAGKAGILLSAISANKETTINNNRLGVLAKAANINEVFELPKLIDVLQQQRLIDKASGGIAVLGVTTASTLQHTADLFESLSPSASEIASIALAERASVTPILTNDIANDLADMYKLASADLSQLFSDAEQIGFVDTEKLGDNQTLLFNGNLFRRDTTQKIKAVLDSMNATEQTKLNELTDILRRQACVSTDHAKQFLGDTLFQKVTAIGLFDISVVSNSTEDVGFLTLPSAFSKYSNSMVDDAFDLAKAFVSSVTYGMTKSRYERGQIQMVDALLSALVRGESVGPVRAIAEDYKVLELKGVVEVKQGTKKGRTGPMLRLLKTEVGELALQAIRQGDVSEHSLTVLPTAAVTTFNGPENNREKVRRTQINMSPKATNDMLSILRTGGGL
ncbi:MULTISPECIES: hypothetical protein [Enterobacteriaceae]|uniref:Uncharacterized protein n=1 Tax=Lelliottia wanjuensis TaxID=3050585 RepID=A0AAP4FYI3_9ENTR|nr:MULTISPECIES: hypothetical protein [Enterobacteriaceae]EAP1797281.1 hypothetical protein [Salmonella enterica]MDK9365935.1 hypothetical protein [Lelliottia sp. V106_12]MDK9616191.1 hypothetical protein [Lelliottia sp. V106_9]OUE52711.1 hypothetical protein AZ003_001602 [Citrobacter freundii]